MANENAAKKNSNDELKSLTESYNYKFFWKIPQNFVLMYRVRFDAKNIKIATEGGKFLLPWHEGILIDISAKTLDYNKQLVEDKNGQNLTIDLAITVGFNDGDVDGIIKYKSLSEGQAEKELKILVESLMRTFVRKFSYEDLSTKNFQLPERYNYNKYADVAMTQEGRYYHKNINTYLTTDELIDMELNNIRKRLDEFSADYGLRIKRLYNKSIDQDQKIQEAYHRKIVAEQVKEAKKIENETLIASKQAESIAIKSYVDNLLAGREVTPEQYQQLLTKVMMIVGQNSVNATFIDTNNQQTASAFTFGNAIGHGISQAQQQEQPENRGPRR
jgi:regulator of protease activity HflC (stomatin/prohibitin superfamily)